MGLGWFQPHLWVGIDEGCTPRPRRDDDAIIKAAAPALARELMAYANESDSREYEGYLENATMLLEECFHSDGYHLARLLEHNGWYVDTQLVDLLDNIEGLYIRPVHNEATYRWVLANAITARYTIGDMVTFRMPSGDHLNGEIVKIHPTEAVYIIHVAEDGHVKSGSGTYGYLIPFERVISGV